VICNQNGPFQTKKNALMIQRCFFFFSHGSMGQNRGDNFGSKITDKTVTPKLTYEQMVDVF